MGILAVNWDDEWTSTVNIDLVKSGIASAHSNNCVVTDVYTGATTKADASELRFYKIAPHDHVAKLMKCLPW